MRRLVLGLLLDWTFVTLGFRGEDGRVTPAPAQFHFAELVDCLRTHQEFAQLGFITAPYNGESVGCIRNDGLVERTTFPRD